MISIKALLSGLMFTSLCMANISGMVTDMSGNFPMVGALVKLEKGGQSAITDGDGKFVIFMGGTSNLPKNNSSLLQGISLHVVGNVLTVVASEQSALGISTFDFNGKLLSTMNKALNIGANSLVLPNKGAGVYVHKVKMGNQEFVIKGNSVSSVGSGNAKSPLISLVSKLAKQTKTMVDIADVISITKDGMLNYRDSMKTSDTSWLWYKMFPNEGNLVDIDGNVYQSVKIGNQVWMTENLRVTKYNDGSDILLDTSTTTWANEISPKYCFYGNTINTDSIKKFGALYNWYVVSPTNAKKIAPNGWHVPSNAEWDALERYLVTNGYNWDGTTTEYKIAKALAAKTDWKSKVLEGVIGNELSKNNTTGFSALPGGYRRSDGIFNNEPNFAGLWWSATAYLESSAFSRSLYCSSADLLTTCVSNGKKYAFSFRLVKD